MNRAEQLHWWRQGYDAGLAAGNRQQLGEHQAAIAEFRAQREADEEAAIGALIAEVVDVLARALGEPSRREDAA